MKAFTIVELLIVIVIIGILAAITIVSYTGITARANQTTIISDLATAKKQFELYKADHGVYPTGLENGTNCLTGTTQPSPDTRYCLKSTSGSTYILEGATGSDYTLKLSKGTIAYKITKDLSPTSTTAVVAATTTFVRTWGGSGSEYGNSLIRTSDGGYAATGYTTSFGGSSGDVYLAKYNANGELSWNKTWGGSTTDYGYSLIQTSDGGYAVTGYTISYGAGSHDVLLIKYDTSGNLIWNRVWGGTNFDIGYSLIQTSDSGYVVAGYTYSYGVGTSVDVLLIKYDSSGNLIWSRLWGGAGDDRGYDITKTSDGGFAVIGTTTSYGAGNEDVFLSKYDTSGNLTWNKVWGGTNTDFGYSVIQGSDNGYAVSGYTNSYGAGNYDMFLMKYDASGNLVWNKLWGGASSDFGYSVIQSNDSGYMVIGGESSYGAGSSDIFLVKYNTNGDLAWNKTWGGVSSDVGYSVVQDSDNGYVISGNTNSYGVGTPNVLILKADVYGVISNCSSPMCQTPTATITTPSATITTPSATVSYPSGTITAPSATITTPAATVTTVMAP